MTTMLNKFSSFITSEINPLLGSNVTQNLLQLIFFLPVDQRDPYFHTAGIHFNNCLKRHGAPILLLNLIKVRIIQLVYTLIIV